MIDWGRYARRELRALPCVCHARYRLLGWSRCVDDCVWLCHAQMRVTRAIGRLFPDKLLWAGHTMPNTPSDSRKIIAADILGVILFDFSLLHIPSSSCIPFFVSCVARFPRKDGLNIPLGPGTPMLAQFQPPLTFDRNQVYSQIECRYSTRSPVGEAQMALPGNFSNSHPRSQP